VADISDVDYAKLFKVQVGFGIECLRKVLVLLLLLLLRPQREENAQLLLRRIRSLFK
jgi:hypothetical protein